MASKRSIVIKICLLLHILEVLFGIVLTVFSFLLQNAAAVGLEETPSWLGIPLALFGLVGIIVIVLNKLKEELVFVLVFHGLIIILCIICLILVAPKAGKWKPVSEYKTSGLCEQLTNNCNCSIALPTRVYSCVDLTGIYDLALITVVVVALSLATAVFAAFFNFYFINNYIPKETPIKPSSQIKGEIDEEQLVDQSDVMGHAGPFNTPDLLPKFDDEDLGRDNSVEWNRREDEAENETNQEEENGTTDATSEVDISLPVGTGSAGSLRSEHASIGSRLSNVNPPLRKNSATASKQSIRSRKDSLIKRLQMAQTNDNDQNEVDQDEALRHAIEADSRSSSRQQLQGSRKGTPNLIRSYPGAEVGDTQEFADQQQVMALSKLSMGNVGSTASPNKSPRHVFMNSSEHSLRESNEKMPPRRGTPLRTRRGTPIPGTHLSDEADDDSENNVQHNRQDASSRRTGYANRNMYGLPPLPLKDMEDNLTIQDRTFSAPTLPCLETGRERKIKARPGSSGSQIVAKSKREYTINTRNDLIDKQMIEHISSRRRSDPDSNYEASERKHSFDSDSIGIDDDDKESEISYGLGRKPRWHPPWQLKQEIVAHKDSVPVISIEPRNRWFASGSTDKSIKIWDVNNGDSRLTVRTHKGGIRALEFGSAGHRYLFSAADDRQLICTDIEVNRAVHHYPDQNSVIYAMEMYHQADLLVTCGRDKYVKIWDTRERKCIKTMRGHMNTVSSLAILQNTGQIISGSHDSTMRIWDIGEGRCTQILTGHEKSVRSIVIHPEEPFISSASTERIIHWRMPDGEKVKDITPKDISINCISVNPQGALVAAGSNGVIHLWDWKSGHKFQKIHRTSVYESQEVPICVFCVAFDKTGSRLLVSDASNVIKAYGEAYTRIRRRYNFGEPSKTKRDSKKFSKFGTPEVAFT